MEQFIGCDAHKKFSVFVAVNEKGHAGEALRVVHDRQVYREFLARLPPHSSIAVEASGSYSWLVDEMERSGHRPKLCNPLEAKRRMGLTKKTDTLDARGLAILLRNGTLPEVWIPPSELRDQRELLRLRIFLVHLRTRVKNRIHGTLARYNVQVPGADLFGVAARQLLGARLPELPEHSREAIEQELATLRTTYAAVMVALQRGRVPVGRELQRLLMDSWDIVRKPADPAVAFSTKTCRQTSINVSSNETAIWHLCSWAQSTSWYNSLLPQDWHKRG